MTIQHMYIQCYSNAREANDCGHRLTTMGAAVNYLFSVTINTKKKSMKIEKISFIVSFYSFCGDSFNVFDRLRRNNPQND